MCRDALTREPALSFSIMCGRFARRSTREVLAEWFGVDLEEAPPFSPNYNVGPQSVQPVLRLGRDSGKPEFGLLRWGLVPFWSKDAKIGYTTINARAEEAATKPAFREALRKRRCLIPADAFYEWDRKDEKNKKAYAIGLKSGEPWALAGLWECWRPQEGEPLETFTILTTDANEVVEPVHNRMPVIVARKDYDRWLQPAAPERLPLDLLRPYPADQMVAWRVSNRVGNVKNNEPELLARWREAEETDEFSPTLFSS